MHIEVNDGKISYVSFSSGKYTDYLKVDSYINKLERQEFSEDKWYKNEKREMEFYESYDRKISVSRTKWVDENLSALTGYYTIDYRYYDNEIAEKERIDKETKEKEEYYKDLKK